MLRPADGRLQESLTMMLDLASGRLARRARGVASAGAITLLLVGSGLMTSAAAATEVDRNGPFINNSKGGPIR
jgi:hypothetical protein